MSQATPHKRGRICLVTAADIEFDNIVKALPEPLIGRELDLRLCRANLSGQHSNRSFVVLQTEMGAPDFADRLHRHLAIFPYDGLIVLGLAGALDPTLKTGDIVIYENCLKAPALNFVVKKPTARDEIVSIACDYALVEWIHNALAAERLTCRRVDGAWVNSVITQTQDKALLYAATNAATVDMESWLVANALCDLNLPFTVVRVVLDEAGHVLPAFNEGLRADGTYDVWNMLRVLMAHPGVSIKILWNLRRATHTLRRITGALLKA